MLSPKKNSPALLSLGHIGAGVFFIFVMWAQCFFCKSGAFADIPPPEIAPSPANVVKEDNKLVASVLKAVGKQLQPEEAVQLVGKRPTFNTIDPKNRREIQVRGNFVVNEKAEGEFIDFVKAKHVVYWIRPIEAIKTKNPRMVGIRWDAKGHAEIFFGSVGIP